jgi:hypothetical protein
VWGALVAVNTFEFGNGGIGMQSAGEKKKAMTSDAEPPMELADTEALIISVPYILSCFRWLLLAS